METETLNALKPAHLKLTVWTCSYSGLTAYVPNSGRNSKHVRRIPCLMVQAPKTGAASPWPTLRATPAVRWRNRRPKPMKKLHPGRADAPQRRSTRGYSSGSAARRQRVSAQSSEQEQRLSDGVRQGDTH
ncbi:Hypothetical predicted protein [Pelobates cultripes]|uniref:Uncharacterized protein n=1 Tax=Pelobates cultripes TaxID=61616 RepID=A0AAD1WNK9_PELCU|nr:Hypothetical predicted protein [Pelobates cultripes]